MSPVADVLDDLAIVVESGGWFGGGYEDAMARLSFLPGDDARAAARLLTAIAEGSVNEAARAAA